MDSQSLLESSPEHEGPSEVCPLPGLAFSCVCVGGQEHWAPTPHLAGPRATGVSYPRWGTGASHVPLGPEHQALYC